MIKTKMTKATALAVSMSLLLTVPAYASTTINQSGQMNPTNIQSQPNSMQGQQNTQNNLQLSNAAQYMVNQGIIKGNTTGSYNMSDNVKRGDMSIMLVRAFNLNNSTANSEGFADVGADSYYHDAIQTIKGLGIAKGDGKNFSPTNNMTLEEAILFVERALSSAGTEYSDSTLRALFDGRSLSDPATREDVATILYAVLGDTTTKTSTTTSTTTVADSITYTTDEDTAVTFDEDDFNDVCDDATDETLSYVKFTLPSSSYGKLYYDYTSSSSYDSKVASTTKYYYDADDDESSLSDVTFVPVSDYTGTVKIAYTAYTTDGTSYTGTVAVTVDADDTVADSITYTTDEDTAVTFDEDDFNDVCDDATDETLSYVKFTLPSSSYGKLYYDYTSSSSYDSKVASTTKYYYDADEDDDESSLSDVTFVPASDYTGTVKITYTAYNTDGKSYTGTIKITVD